MDQVISIRVPPNIVNAATPVNALRVEDTFQGFVKALIWAHAAADGVRMEIVCTGGRRIIVGAEVELDALVCLVAALDR